MTCLKNIVLTFCSTLQLHFQNKLYEWHELGVYIAVERQILMISNKEIRFKKQNKTKELMEYYLGSNNTVLPWTFILIIDVDRTRKWSDLVALHIKRHNNKWSPLEVLMYNQLTKWKRSVLVSKVTKLMCFPVYRPNRHTQLTFRSF